MKKPISLIALFLLAVSLGAAEPDWKQILEEIDRSKNFTETDFSSVVTVVTEEPGEETSVKKVRMFRRDGQDKYVILILKPDIQKGEGYLQADDNLWFYDPESRKFAHTSIKENFQDSSAKHSDFRRSSLAEDYAVIDYTLGRLGRYEVYIVDLEGVHNEVTYPYLRLWIRRDIHLVLKVEDYSLNRRLLRTAFYPSYVRVGDKTIPSKMLFIDELIEGKKTQLTFKNISIDPLPDSVFTKSFIERANR
jgi:outer membrane lipoprotein-sorting protein